MSSTTCRCYGGHSCPHAAAEAEEFFQEIKPVCTRVIMLELSVFHSAAVALYSDDVTVCAVWAYTLSPSLLREEV